MHVQGTHSMLGLSAALCASTGAAPATKCQAGVGDSQHSFPACAVHPCAQSRAAAPGRDVGCLRMHIPRQPGAPVRSNRGAGTGQPYQTDLRALPAPDNGTLQRLTQTQGSAKVPASTDHREKAAEQGSQRRHAETMRDWTESQALLATTCPQSLIIKEK